MEDTKICPLCGETIKASAKKCRYCGEWLTDENTPVPVSAPAESVSVTAEVPEAEPLEVATPAEGQLPLQAQPTAVPGQPVTIDTASGQNPSQTIMTAGGQPIILNVQQSQTVQQKVEQTVVVAGGGSSESAPGWIFGEMWLIAAGIGLAMSSWWWFFIVGIVGSILLIVPFIGAVMCVVLGAAWGILAGALAAGMFSTAAGWVVGILVGIGAIYGHLEARKKNMDELDD